MATYAIGLDFGTNSCRSLIVDLSDGREISSSVFPYPSGAAGVLVDPSDPNLARQNPNDYIIGTERSITAALRLARENDRRFSPSNVVGIGVATTGSSPLPVDAGGRPLSFSEPFADDPNAMVWLWKDHTSFAEAARITETAAAIRPQYLSTIGGVYSSEWWWSKILHCRNVAPRVFEAAASWMEICDWIPAMLTGETDPRFVKRSVCAAGHKAMFNTEWGGLPDEAFLDQLAPGLGNLRKNLYSAAWTSDKVAGRLSKDWCEKLGLPPSTVVAVGAFDAHLGAIGAGIVPGTLVKIVGTSTCDIMIHSRTETLPPIPGVCGIVDGSVVNGYYGIEAGQSGVGDIFLWFVNSLVPEQYGKTADEKFDALNAAAALLLPGESGLLALDWNNGNRTILVDVRLTGLLLGQTLQTTPPEIYRALIEATGFGALAIINRIEEYGVQVKEIVNCGGLAMKNPVMMQIYADITGRTMKISRSEQTPALGAAIAASVAAGVEAGGHRTVEEACSTMTGTGTEYRPDRRRHDTYRELYALYRQMHDGFGTTAWNGSMHNVMKDLLEIRDRVRRERTC